MKKNNFLTASLIANYLKNDQIFLPTTPGIEASWLTISVTPNLLVGRSVNLEIVLSSATVFLCFFGSGRKGFTFQGPVQNLKLAV